MRSFARRRWLELKPAGSSSVRTWREPPAKARMAASSCSGNSSGTSATSGEESPPGFVGAKDGVAQQAAPAPWPAARVGELPELPCSEPAAGEASVIR